MQAKKIALIAGTKEKSIGRVIASKLYENEYEIWLYGRSADKIDRMYWHERKCDLNNQNDVDLLFAEIQSPDVIIFSADSGGIGELKDISKDDIDNFINSKINGSLGLIKKILSKKHNKKITMIWLAGGMSQKPKELFLYYIINAALNCLVTALNYHYGDNINAYYLETPLVSPSTLGDAFILRYGENYKELSMIPEETAGRVVNILNNKSIFPGLISLENQKGSL